MKLNFHLVVNRRGSVRTVVNRPALAMGEIAIAMVLEVPAALFQKPQLQASITIPETAAAPREVTAEVADNIRGLIQLHLNDHQVLIHTDPNMHPIEGKK